MKIKLLVIIGALFVTSLQAFESGVGNGGVSVVCRDGSDRIISAELLDIFEGHVRYKKLYDTRLDSDTMVELAQLKLVEHLAFLEAFRKELAKVRSILTYIPDGNLLTPTDDAFPAVSKEDCEFEQVANYTNDGDLLVSLEVFNEFDELNKAALLVHEAVYALFRERGEKDSRQARKLTAELLAKNADPRVIDEIIKFSYASRSESCGTEGTVDERIKDCNTLNGAYALVSKTEEGHEVFKDLASGLLWSDRLSLKMTHLSAVKVCNEWLKEVAGISSVSWRLPSIQEYREADYGIRNAIPSMKYYTFWSSSMIHPASSNAWTFDGKDGGNYNLFRHNSASVRCVGL